jgi:hypothetical protein
MVCEKLQVAGTLIPEVDIDLTDVGHHISRLEAVLVKVFHLSTIANFKED